MLQKIRRLFKKPIVIFLLVLLLILIVLKILVGNFSDNQDNGNILPSITPTPTIFTSLFNTQTIPTTTTPKYQGEPNFRLRIDREIKEYYPLFNQTPFSTENWSIDYTDKMQVTVILKQDTSEIRQEVLDWMTDRGANPQAHKIIWKTQ